MEGRCEVCQNAALMSADTVVVLICEREHDKSERLLYGYLPVVPQIAGFGRLPARRS